MPEWIKNHNLTICCLQEVHFKYKNTYRLKTNGWRKIYHTSTYQRKAGVALLISERVDCKVRKVIRDKKRYYIKIRGSILQDFVTIFKMCETKNRAWIYMRQELIELQGKIDESTIIVGDFNTLSVIDRSSRHEASKNTVELNSTINQLS